MTSIPQRLDPTTGLELTVHRVIAAVPEAAFDGFVDMYDHDRPDWIVESHLELRVGGTWVVVFAPPELDPYAETRVITELDPPQLLAYEMAALDVAGRPRFATTVRLTFTATGGVTEAQLWQRGFPTAALRDEFGKAWEQVFGLLALRLER